MAYQLVVNHCSLAACHKAKVIGAKILSARALFSRFVLVCMYSSMYVRASICVNASITREQGRKQQLRGPSKDQRTTGCGGSGGAGGAGGATAAGVAEASSVGFLHLLACIIEH